MAPPKKVKNVEPVAVEINGSDSADEHPVTNGAGDKPKAKGRGRPKKTEAEKPVVGKEVKPAAAGDTKPRGRPAADKTKVAAAVESESSGDDVAMEADNAPQAKKGRGGAAAPAPKKTDGAAKKGRGRPPKKVNGD